MLEPTLFRRVLTDGLVNEVRDLCDITGGHVRYLPNDDFLAREHEAADRLEQAGVHLCRTADGSCRERAGLYSLLGALTAIEDGVVPLGDNVLVVHTGGAGYCHADPCPPEHVAGPENAVAYAAGLLTEFLK
jgi:hypothetical protein